MLLKLLLGQSVELHAYVVLYSILGLLVRTKGKCGMKHLQLDACLKYLVNVHVCTLSVLSKWIRCREKSCGQSLLSMLQVLESVVLANLSGCL